ncbi:MAG TPA: hypothetical protein VIL48_11450 [Acidimicrobiales bacterium]
MRRVVSPWDVAGIVLLAFVMLCVTEYAVENAADNLTRLSHLRLATVLAGVASLVTVGLASFADPARLREVPARLTAVWRDPPGDGTMFAVVFALSLPLLAFYTPILLGDSDSVRIITATRHVQRHGPGFLIDTQDNFGPHLILGPAVAIGGIGGVRFVTILTVMALAGVTAVIARRVSGSNLAGFVAAVALLSVPAVLSRTIYVPMYPAMLAFGYLGAWLAHRAISEGQGWRLATGAAFCLVLSFECQSVGQLFMATPVLLLILATDLRRALGMVARIYGVVAVICIPRLAVNLSEGGLSRLTSNRTDYWINKGYVREIQTDFWEYRGVGESIPTYVSRLPGRFVESLGDFGWVVLAIALVTILFLRGRARLFALACVLFMATACTVKTVPPFSRYFSPLWPGMAILAGVFVAGLARRRRTVATVLGRLTATAVAGVLVVVAVASYQDRADTTSNLANRIEVSPYRQLAEMIDDGKGVIGSRAHVLVNIDSEIETYGGQFLTEEEYATFLTWPSDEEVIEMLDRHDIGWVLVNPNRRIEIDYHNTWLLPNHGERARHVWMVARSPYFCKVASPQAVTLYRLDHSAGPCPFEERYGEAPVPGLPPSPIPGADDPPEGTESPLAYGANGAP